MNKLSKFVALVTIFSGAVGVFAGMLGFYTLAYIGIGTALAVVVLDLVVKVIKS